MARAWMARGSGADVSADVLRRVRGPVALAAAPYWAEWQWTPNDDGGVTWVDFRVWSSVSTSEPLFSSTDPAGSCSDGMVSDAREAPPLVDGFCKWDGCMQMSINWTRRRSSGGARSTP